MAQRPPKWL